MRQLIQYIRGMKVGWYSHAVQSPHETKYVVWIKTPEKQ